MVYSPKEILRVVKPHLKLSPVQKTQVNDLVSKIMTALEKDALARMRTDVDLQGNRWEKSYDFPSYYSGLIISEVMSKLRAKGWDVEYFPKEINRDYVNEEGIRPSIIDRFYITPKQESK